MTDAEVECGDMMRLLYPLPRNPAANVEATPARPGPMPRSETPCARARPT